MPTVEPQAGNSTEAALNSPYLTLLLAVLMLLVGFLYGGYRTSWEQERLAEGAVAHYGIWKNYKPGFEEFLSEVIVAQGTVANEMNRLSAEHVKAAGDAKEDTQKQWQAVNTGLNQTISGLKLIRERYGLTSSERQAMEREIIAKIRELSAPTDRATREPQPTRESKPDKKEKPKADGSKTESPAKPLKSNDQKSEPARKKD